MTRIKTRQHYYRLSAIFALVALLLGAYGWYKFTLQPIEPDNTQSVYFDISSGNKASTVAKNLKSANLIRDSRLFLLYLDLHSQRGKLKAGTYELKASYSVPLIADIITTGKVRINRLVIPEGTTLAQIKTQAVSKGVMAEQFDAALDQNYGKDFLIGRPPGITLEGYLFPDSYQIDSSASAEKVVGSMIDNFDRKVSFDLRQRFTDLGLTLHQGITVASIVEKEVTSAEDRAKVAQVILKRYRMGMRLEVDPTVDYAASLLGQPFSLDLNSPYNTYRVVGLPPGPICNPGLDAIRAASNPSNTDFLYFVSGRDGKTYFSKTFAEHQQNVTKYMR